MKINILHYNCHSGCHNLISVILFPDKHPKRYRLTLWWSFYICDTHDDDDDDDDDDDGDDDDDDDDDDNDDDDDDADDGVGVGVRNLFAIFECLGIMILMLASIASKMKIASHKGK